MWHLCGIVAGYMMENVALEELHGKCAYVWAYIYTV